MKLTNIIDKAFIAMDEALRDPSTVPLKFNPQGFNTGLSVTQEDLERLFSLMAEAAHLFRMHDGPAPEHWADTWKQAASECAAVCREASKKYLSLCIDNGQPIVGEIRERQGHWNYMADLFDTWPNRSGTIRFEPSSITEAAASEAVEVHEDPGNEKHLLYIPTSYNQTELHRIFASLKKGGFIDGRAPASEQDFLNAFDPKAKQQGRIIWKKVAKSRTLNKMAICDFLRLLGIKGREDLREYASAIFGVAIGKSTLTNCVGGSAEREALQTIIDNAAKQ